MLQPKHTQDTYRRENGPEGIRVMHGVVGKNLGPMQRSSQGPGRRMVLSFPSPFLFPTGLKLKFVEEKELSISGTNEAPGPWRVDLVVQYYKIYLRKKQPRPPSSPSVSWSSGPTSTCRCWTGKGERVIAGHWCQFTMEQHKIFPAL